MDLHTLEPDAEWRGPDVADPEVWTLHLTGDDENELEEALQTAKAHSSNPLDITREEFPLPTFADKLAEVATTLIAGRGFVRISKLDVGRYSDDELSLLYWGIGLHLGDPWPQNHYGHVLGDVTDQGKIPDDPTARGNELGHVALDYHTDGSDLVGLLCLRPARSGGLSCVANGVAIHNHMVLEHTLLASALYDPLPYDLRGQEADGRPPYACVPAFTEHLGRLFIRFIPDTSSLLSVTKRAPPL